MRRRERGRIKRRERACERVLFCCSTSPAAAALPLRRAAALPPALSPQSPSALSTLARDQSPQKAASRSRIVFHQLS
jgi:hypothetical protein